MNVTFLLGNGFDLNLGLSTSYKDFIAIIQKKSQTILLLNLSAKTTNCGPI